MLNLEAIKKAYFNYLELSSYLFGKGEKAIYDINEMPKSHKFYTHAKQIASQLGIDWNTMSHEDSNRIMLTLLEDLYMSMADTLIPAERKKVIIEVSFKLKKDK